MHQCNIIDSYSPVTSIVDRLLNFCHKLCKFYTASYKCCSKCVPGCYQLTNVLCKL